MTRATRAPLVPILSVLFFASGASALVYQALWARQLALIFGVTIYAASTVLAAFMGGLAIGSYVAGRAADRIRRPLAWFGAAEALIGVSALLTPPALGLVETVYVAASASMPGPALVTLRFLLAAGVLILPASAMGATLPLIVKSALGRSDALGPRVGLLYGINTAGAIGGALVTGLWLVPEFGMQRTFLLAAAVNGAVALAAFLLSPSLRPDATTPAAAAGEPPLHAVSPSLGRPLLVVMTLSGLATLALEVVWFRIFILYLRPTTYAFTLMLAAVLTGIAAGSLVITPLLRRRWNWVAVFAGLQFAIAALCLLSFRFMVDSQAVMAWAAERFPAFDYLAPVLAASFFAILPATLGLGLAFPVGVMLWSASQAGRRGATESLGVLYSLNVLGAIAGSLLAGFVLLPWLGPQASLFLLCTIPLFSGLLIAWHLGGRVRVAVAGAGLAACAAAALVVPDVFTSILARRYPDHALLWHREGIQSSVAVMERPGMRLLVLEGMHQANDDPGMVSFHRTIGLIGLAVHTAPANVLVIGLGGGATAGAAAVYPAMVDVVELAPAVIEGATHFRHINFDVHDRPNATIRRDDGRNALLLGRKRYDVVTADIILPHLAGAGNLYSQDYYRLVARALSDDGLMVQWLGRDSEFQYKVMVRTFLSVFPDATLWSNGSLLIGGRRPIVLDREAFERKLAYPPIRRAFDLIGLRSFEDLLASYTAGPDELRAWVGDGQILTDDRPLLEYFLWLPRNLPRADLSGLHGSPDRFIVNR